MRNRQPAPTFKKGDRALYDSCLSSEAPRPGTIVLVGGERNGETILYIDLDDGDKRWGYVDQFEALPGTRQEMTR